MYYGNSSTTTNNFDPKTLSTKKGPLTPEERAALIKYIQEKSGGGSSSGGSSSGSKAVGTVGSTLATAGGKYAANKAWDYYSGSSALPDNTSIDTSGQFQYTSPDAGGGYQLQSQSPGSTKLGSSQAAQAQTQAQGQQAAQPQSGTGNNYAQLAQGAAGAVQLYGAYEDYKDKEYTGAALKGASGIANAYTGYVGATQGATAASQTTLGQAVPYLNAALGAYNVYQARNNENVDAATRSAMANHEAQVAVGSAYTFGIAGLADYAIKKWAPSIYESKIKMDAKYDPMTKQVGRMISGKDTYQFMRDQLRKHLKESKILDDKYQGTLADGSKFDFGKDGSTIKLDYKDPVTGEVIAKADLLAEAEGLTGKNREANAMMYANAALSNASGDQNKALQNIAYFMNQRGMNKDSMRKSINDTFSKYKDDKGNFVNANDKQRYDVYMAGIDSFAPNATPVGKIAQALGTPGMRLGKTFNRSTGKYTDNKRANGRR